MIPKRTALTAAVASAAMLFSACARKEEVSLRVDRGLAARIGDVKITENRIDDLMEQLPPQLQSRYRGREGRANYVDAIIDEELLYLAAKNSDVRYDDEIKEQLRRAEMRVLIGAYDERVIRRRVEVTEADIERYYQQNWDQFTKKAIIRASHLFSTDRLKVVDWKQRLEAGESFRVLAEESEDRTTSHQFGSLGYFNPGGYVMFYGASDEFWSQISHLEAGEISDVVVTEKGYSLVLINDKQHEALKPLAEVRQTILDRIRSEKARVELDREIAVLRERYRPVNLVRQKILETLRSPEEIWALIQEGGSPYLRIQYYRNIVNLYPDHEFAPQALFMIGFVYAEELHMSVDARRTFDELLKKYPDSEVAESARWMIENLGRPHPKLESVEELQRKIQADRQK